MLMEIEKSLVPAYARFGELVPYNPYSGHSLSRAHCIAIQHIQPYSQYIIKPMDAES